MLTERKKNYYKFQSHACEPVLRLFNSQKTINFYVFPKLNMRSFMYTFACLLARISCNAFMNFSQTQFLHYATQNEWNCNTNFKIELSKNFYFIFLMLSTNIWVRGTRGIHQVQKLLHFTAFTWIWIYEIYVNETKVWASKAFFKYFTKLIFSLFMQVLVWSYVRSLKQKMNEIFFHLYTLKPNTTSNVEESNNNFI